MLTYEEEQSLRRILAVIYGEWAMQYKFRPDATTVHHVEEMLHKIMACNKQIRYLLAGIPCAIRSRGWLRRCLRETAQILKLNSLEFRGCQYIMGGATKARIFSNQ